MYEFQNGLLLIKMFTVAAHLSQANVLNTNTLASIVFLHPSNSLSSLIHQVYQSSGSKTF